MDPELYQGWNIDYRESGGGWFAGRNQGDGYDETGPFQTKEAAMEWVDSLHNR